MARLSQPYLIVESYPDNVTHLSSTNLATRTSRSIGFTAASTPQSTNLLATSGLTLKRLSNLQNGSTYYFHVSAVNRQGVEGLPSNEASATVNIIQPGQNMIA